MMPAIVVGVLVSVTALVIARPLMKGVRRSSATTGVTEEDAHRELLRQLRDLDEDLAAGKLAEADHRRLRAPVEAQAAAALDQLRSGRQTGRVRLPGRQGHPIGTGARAGGRRRARRWLVGLGVIAAASAGVGMTLAQSVDPRAPGGTLSGGAPGAERTPAAAGPLSPSTELDGTKQVTEEQVAAVDAAAARVLESPKDVAAHVDLARAYAAADQAQLSTIEYLAVTRLDAANPEANTALALVAFMAGQPQEAMSLVDKVLAAHPKHPEALYTRGLIGLMGLKQVVPAERDLRAYLDVAPFGSHRSTVETLLAMIPDREAP